MATKPALLFEVETDKGVAGLGLPLWQLLGGYRRRVPAYATGGFYSCGNE